MKKKGYEYDQTYYVYLIQHEERIKAELIKIKESGQRLGSSNAKRHKKHLSAHFSN